MTDATVSRLGQANASGDVDALFLKVYSGEVLTAFETNVLMNDKHMVRTISSGKSAQFPMTWKIGSSYHTPGAEIVGKQVKHNEKVITIDDVLISDAFIAEIDEAKNHYEVRSIYSTEQGRELAKSYDKNVFRNVVLASRGTHPFDSNYDGQQIERDFLASSGSNVADAIYDSVAILDLNDVPEQDRYAVLAVPQYYLLVQNTVALNKDWGGSGSYAKGVIGEVGGVGVFKSNNVPQSDDRSNSDIPAAYQADYQYTVGGVFHMQAAGTVKLMDLAMESGWDMRRQGTLMLAKYAVGHGPLRVDAAVELRTNTPLT